ncbi:syndecan-2-like [Thunnus thynnus]|uniref:syndecan-2-like n=1 Tax=Thunnus thynnus TaxID=8237 RepID=UPI00352911E7
MRNLWLLFVVGLATGFISEKLLVSSQSPSSTADDLYLEGRPSGDFPIDDEDSEDNGSGSGSGDYAFIDLADKEELLRRFLNLSDTTFSKETVPVQPQPTDDSHHNSPTREEDSQNPPTTEEHTEATPSIFHEDRDEKVPGIGPTADSFTHDTSPSSTSMPSSEATATEFSIDTSVTKDADEDRLDDPAAKDIEDKVLIQKDVNDVNAKDGRDSRTYVVDSPEEVTSENTWERTEVLAAVIACGVIGFLCAVFLLLLLAYRMKKKDEGSYDLGDTKLPTTAYHQAPTKEFYA